MPNSMFGLTQRRVAVGNDHRGDLWFSPSPAICSIRRKIKIVLNAGDHGRTITGLPGRLPYGFVSF